MFDDELSKIPAKKIKCPKCEGTGKTGNGIYTCSHCGGYGEVEK